LLHSGIEVEFEVLSPERGGGSPNTLFLRTAITTPSAGWVAKKIIPQK